VLATVSTTRTQTLRDAGESTASALVGGYHVAFLIGAGTIGLAVLVALVVLQPATAPAPHGAPATAAPHEATTASEVA
jgi:hypothetical protein